MSVSNPNSDIINQSSVTSSGTYAPSGYIPAADGVGNVEWVVGSDNRRYIALYNQFIGSPPIHYDLGQAVSADGRTWTIEAEPAIPRGATGTWDDHTLQFPNILEVNGILYCYYAGKNTDSWANFNIGLVRSFDAGLTWTKYGGNPIVSGTANYISPRVLYDLEETDPTRRWKMWVGVGSFGLSIYYLYSADGLSWTSFGANPVLSLGGSGAWDDTYISPHDIVKRGSTYLLFYGGKHGAMWQSGLATFTNPEGTYTKYALNPILGGDGITTSLTADLPNGTTTATVSDATIFPIGCPVWVFDGSTRFLTHVVAQLSSTSLQLADTAPVTISTTGGTVRSVAYNSIDITKVNYRDGFIFALCPHQPDGAIESGVHEVSMLGYATDNLEKAYIDYTSGITIPVTVAESENANVSRENWSFIEMWDTARRHKPVDVSGSGLLDPGSNGVVKRTSLNTTSVAVASDVTGLFSGSGDYLKSNGTKGTPTVGAGKYRQMVYEVSGGAIDFLTDGNGNPLFDLLDVE